MTEALPAPAGFEGLTPYLCVSDARKAIAFHAEAFGAAEDMRIENQGQVGHAEMTVFGAKIMLSDPASRPGPEPPDALGGTPVVLHAYVDDVDAAFARAVAAGAAPDREPADQFYGDRSARVIDPFGHFWSLATRVEDVPADELRKRAAEMFGE